MGILLAQLPREQFPPKIYNPQEKNHQSHWPRCSKYPALVLHTKLQPHSLTALEILWLNPWRWIWHSLTPGLLGQPRSSSRRWGGLRWPQGAAPQLSSHKFLVNSPLLQFKVIIYSINYHRHGKSDYFLLATPCYMTQGNCNSNFLLLPLFFFLKAEQSQFIYFSPVDVCSRLITVVPHLSSGLCPKKRHQYCSWQNTQVSRRLSIPIPRPRWW